MFNMKYKFVHLLLFDVKFLFPKKHTFHKQKRTAVDRRVPLVPDFKLTRKSNHMLPSRGGVPCAQVY